MVGLLTGEPKKKKLIKTKESLKEFTFLSEWFLVPENNIFLPNTAPAGTEEYFVNMLQK